jgi:WD40 repeat protein
MRGARGVDTGGICAHDAEILSLSYSPMISRKSLLNNGDIDLSYPRVATPLVMLASGGRDRLVHVFDASLSPSQDAPRYGIISTLDSHSSSVTVVKFTPDGDRLVSCGGDKLMVINSVVGSTISKIKSIQSSHGTINGLAIDIATNKYAVSSGQDKRINVWNLHNGKLMRSYRPVGVDCELFKTCMDPSGMFIATSSFDKIIRIFDFFSGDLVAQVLGRLYCIFYIYSLNLNAVERP